MLPAMTGIGSFRFFRPGNIRRAVSFISMIRQDEPFILDTNEIIMHLMRKDDGCCALEQLLKLSA